MVIYFGADHGGFELKGRLREAVREMGYEVADLGTAALDPADDYPDFAIPVARKVDLEPDTTRGILICRSGAGMCIVANRFKNVRAVLPFSPDHAYAERHDNDANVLCLAADYTDEETAKQIVKVFLNTPFGTDERYKRRLQKIAAIEPAPE